LVDLRPGVASVSATQATQLSSSRKVTSISISVSTSSSIRGSSLSSSSNSSTVRSTSKEEISTSVKTTRHLAFLPSSQPEQSGSFSARRRSWMFPLWGIRSLGGSLPKEGYSVAASFQHFNKTRSSTTSTRRSWPGLQPWEGEPLGGRGNPGCTRCGSRYISSRILSSKSTI
jgi:hypothetical protein